MTKTSATAGNIKTEKKRRPPKRITESYLHNSGLYYLQRFPASTAHFRRVMTRKIDRSCKAHKEQDRETCLEMLESVIAKFRELGLLNDDAYTRGMVDSLRRRGMSARMIRARLQNRGLGGSAIDEALAIYDEQDEGDTELTAALRYARRKKLGPYATAPHGEKEMEKALAALARAGFTYDMARRTLDMTKEEAEEMITRF